MPSKNETDIIELTEVIEEGHPDRPNLPPRTKESTPGESIDDLDLEKEIDQIFADLGPPPAAEGPADAEKSMQDELDLDDLFDDSEAPTHEQNVDVHQPSEQGDAPDAPSLGPADLAHDVPLHADMEEAMEQEAMEQEAMEEGARESVVNAEPETLQSEASGPDMGSGPDQPIASTAKSDQLALFEERLATVEEKAAQLDNLEQTISERLESQLGTFAEELLARQEERLTTFGQDLRAELERHFEQKLQDAVEETSSRNQETLTQTLAAQTEEMTASLDARVQEALQAGRPSQEEQDVDRQKMLEELQARTMEALQPMLAELRAEWEAEKDRLAQGPDLHVEMENLRDQWRAFQEQAGPSSQEEQDVDRQKMLEELQARTMETLQPVLAELRDGLLDELNAAIPAAAARIIREEIQALSQEEG